MVTELSGNIYGLEDEIFLEPKEVVKSWKDYKDLFLLLALLLYMVDILIRRFHITVFGSIADMLRKKKGSKLKAIEEKTVFENTAKAELTKQKTEEINHEKDKTKVEKPKPKKEKKKKEKEEVQALDTAALIKNLRDKK